MRVLFLIPKARAPVLEGNFSNAFKDFVALCLIKDPKDVRSLFSFCLLLRHPLVIPLNWVKGWVDFELEMGC